MKLANTLFAITCLLGILLSFNACTAISVQTAFSKKKDAIPPDFGSDPEHILVFLLSDESRYNRKVLRIGREVYKGKLVFLSKRQLETEEYSDTDIYRYVFQHSGHSSFNTYSPNSSGSYDTNQGSYLKIGMYDRKEKQRYFNNAGSTQYGLLIRYMAKKLEKERKSILDD